MTFGVISFRFVEAGLVPLAAVPLVYAGAMAVEAVAALATGDLFDRHGGRVLLGVPLVAAPVPPLVFAPNLWPVLAGMGGFRTGVRYAWILNGASGVLLGLAVTFFSSMEFEIVDCVR
jgi:hypothetical protein